MPRADCAGRGVWSRSGLAVRPARLRRQSPDRYPTWRSVRPKLSSRGSDYHLAFRFRQRPQAREDMADGDQAPRKRGTGQPLPGDDHTGGHGFGAIVQPAARGHNLADFNNVGAEHQLGEATAPLQTNVDLPRNSLARLRRVFFFLYQERDAEPSTRLELALLERCPKTNVEQVGAGGEAIPFCGACVESAAARRWSGHPLQFRTHECFVITKN